MYQQISLSGVKSITHETYEREYWDTVQIDIEMNTGETIELTLISENNQPISIIDKGIRVIRQRKEEVAV